MIPSPNNPRAQHDSAIQSLVEQTHLSREEIAELYEAELEALRPEVKITQYLSLIVSKRVVRWLKEQSSH